MLKLLHTGHALLLCALASGGLAYAQSTPTSSALAEEAQTQRNFAAKLYLMDLNRTQRVAYSLLKSASPYCLDRRKYSIGIPAVTLTEFPADLREGVEEVAGLDPKGPPKFINVVQQSPVSDAGIKEGDLLLSLVDIATKKPAQSSWTLDRPAITFTINEEINAEILRDGKKMVIGIRPQLICDLKPQLVRDERLIANIASGTLQLSTGLLRFVRNNDELALIVANEIVHAAMEHSRPAAKDITEQAERTADYLGAYITVLSGYDILRAQDIWRRIAAASGGKSGHDLAREHPLSAARGIWQREIVDEIRRKQLAGQLLTPDPRSLPPALRGQIADTGIRQSNTMSPEQKTDEVDPRLARIEDVPFVDNEGRAGYQRFLATALRPRAFAIAPGNSRGAWSYKTGANAVANALAHCQVLASSSGSSCYLYAIDDRVVWNPATALLQPEPPEPASGGRRLLLQRPRASGFASVEDLKLVPLPQDKLAAYKAFLEKPAPRAFIITQEGEGRYWLGPSSMEDALSYCERLGTPCWLYAVDNAVVWHSDRNKRLSRRDQLPAAADESLFLDGK